jgi:hypothetical protein
MTFLEQIRNPLVFLINKKANLLKKARYPEVSLVAVQNKVGFSASSLFLQ